MALDSQCLPGDLSGMQQGVRDTGSQVCQREHSEMQLVICSRDAAAHGELRSAPSALTSQLCLNTTGCLPPCI